MRRPTPRSDCWGSVERACKIADHLVEQLLVERARGKVRHTRIGDAAELRLALEQAVGRPLVGDFVRLFRMLTDVINPLTPAALAQLGEPGEVLARGQRTALALKVAADDVVTFVLGISPEYQAEFLRMATRWRGPRTVFRRAMEAAVGMGAPMGHNAGSEDDAADPQ